MLKVSSTRLPAVLGVCAAAFALTACGGMGSRSSTSGMGNTGTYSSGSSSSGSMTNTPTQSGASPVLNDMTRTPNPTNQTPSGTQGGGGTGGSGSGSGAAR